MSDLTSQSKIKVVIIPGNGGSTMDDHWFPYIISAFTKHHVPVVANNYPDPYLARRQFWLPFIENDLRADEHTVLVGHSSGAEAAMRYAEEHRILGSVLVSPCHTDMGNPGETISGWYNEPWQWEKIKEHQDFIIQFSSRDDPIVPIAEQDFVRERLQPEYHQFSDRGHFIGITVFPELVAAVMENIKKLDRSTQLD